MSIQSQITLICSFAGENNDVIPRLCRLHCPNNTIEEITTAGFLDNYLKTQSISLLTTDFVLTVASNGHTAFKAVFANDICTLTSLP